MLDRINVVHNKVVRYVTFSKPCSRAWPLYCKLNVLPLNILAELEWGKFMYKFQNKMLPKAFDSYFKVPSHQHGTRYARQKNFELVRFTNAKEKSMIKCFGPKKWSLIPIEIKETLFSQNLYQNVPGPPDRHQSMKCSSISPILMQK